MVARNEVLEQLGHTVKEEELISKNAASEQAESFWSRWRQALIHLGTPCSSGYPSIHLGTPCSSGYPSRSLSPESRAILKEEDGHSQANESSHLVAHMHAQRVEELAHASKATRLFGARRARAIFLALPPQLRYKQGQ